MIKAIGIAALAVLGVALFVGSVFLPPIIGAVIGPAGGLCFVFSPLLCGFNRNHYSNRKDAKRAVNFLKNSEVQFIKPSNLGSLDLFALRKSGIVSKKSVIKIKEFQKRESTLRTQLQKEEPNLEKPLNEEHPKLYAKIAKLKAEWKSFRDNELAQDLPTFE